jgi:hypothetical protein
MNPNSSAPAAAHGAGVPPVLRVLSGVHTGAESELRAERLLIGNLEAECDLVLDVGSPERHACLLRTSADGWTVLAIAGDLWLGEAYVPPQQTQTIESGSVLTLGRVAFCIADPQYIDWLQVKAPYQLLKPDAVQGTLPQAALLPSRAQTMQRWRALKLAAGVGVGTLVLASAGTYLGHAWTAREPAPETARSQFEAGRTAVGTLPYAGEVKIAPHPEAPERLVVNGFVPERRQIGELHAALQSAGSNAVLRVTAVQDLQADLMQRFAEQPPQQVQYERDGHFALTSVRALVPQHDHGARLAMQELPQLAGVALKVADMQDEQGQPLVVRYARSASKPGAIEVSRLDAVQRPPAFKVVELRFGRLPSVVLDDGQRYFEGARLPDGSLVERIEADALVVSRAGAQARVALTGAQAPEAMTLAALPEKRREVQAKRRHPE